PDASTSQSTSLTNAPPPKPKKVKVLNFQNFNVGLVTALVAQPFEVMRTSSITSLKNNANNLAGTWTIIKEIFQKEGFKGFFRGGLTSLGKSTISAGVFFTGLENVHVLTNHLRDYKYIPPNAVDFFNACCSRTLTTLTINPMNVIKTRFEVVGSNQYSSILHAVKSIYQKDGLKGFYKGIVPTIIRDVPYSGLQYSSYRWGMDLWGRHISPNKNAYDSSLVVSLVGAVSSIFAVLVTYPFDNIRVRLQCNDMMGANQPSSEHKGMVSMAKYVYHNEGMKGFYLGYVPRLMKKGTATALSWVVYEKLRRKDTVIH
ncbi:MAG: solute carrier family 25 protein, partial [Sphingobacteriales bacterium]